MKKIILLIALCVAGVASAQPGAGSAVMPADKGAAAGAGPGGTATAAPPAGSGAPTTTGSATEATGSGSAGSGSAAAAAGSGSAAGSGAADTGSAAAGSAAAAAGSADAGSAAAGSGSGTGTGTGSAAPAGPKAKAWYDQLADVPIQEGGSYWLPKAVNEASDESDMMFYTVLALSAFFFVAIAILVVYFTIKYRHRPGHKAEPSPAHNDAMEITWTVIPTIIVVFLFYYGWRGYIKVVTPPQKAVEINVLAWRWSWQFTHANGVTDSDLHVPANTPVRLVMTSKDVLHSFYAPAMRVKQDVVPRRYTYAWFKATKPGTYRLTCAEYCGTNHSQMACLANDPDTQACLRRAVVVVHEQSGPHSYEAYLADKQANEQNMDPVKLGGLLFEKKNCNSCHTIDGSPRVGPTWSSKDWGQDVEMADGKLVKIDENYLRESIEYPQAKARKHDPPYPPSMPSFQGQLKEKEIQALISYIHALKTGAVK